MMVVPIIKMKWATAIVEKIIVNQMRIRTIAVIKAEITQLKAIIIKLPPIIFSRNRRTLIT